MGLHASKQTAYLTVMSQIPIALLLIIFYRIPSMPMLFRGIATAIVVFEAALMSELIGNIVQKVRTNDKGAVIRGVFERHLIMWEDIDGLRQVVVSPMKRGSVTRQQPVKLFLVKTKEDYRLEQADEWWVKNGPIANRQGGIADLVERYDAWVRKELKGWTIIWVNEYRHPQNPGEDAHLQYMSWDGREKSIIDNLSGHHKKGVKFMDLTYPHFVAEKGGKYSKDVEHVWDTLE